jgi:hypothetical protein
MARKPGAISENRGAPRKSPAVKPWISLAPMSRSGSMSVVQLPTSSPQGESPTAAVTLRRIYRISAKLNQATSVVEDA